MSLRPASSSSPPSTTRYGIAVYLLWNPHSFLVQTFPRPQQHTTNNRSFPSTGSIGDVVGAEYESSVASKIMKASSLLSPHVPLSFPPACLGCSHLVFPAPTTFLCDRSNILLCDGILDDSPCFRLWPVRIINLSLLS